jgi:hypothetical protein
VKNLALIPRVQLAKRGFVAVRRSCEQRRLVHLLNAQGLMLNAQCQMLNAQCQMLNAQSSCLVGRR